MESTMLTLCGFAVSNYYNKVKIALLEKGIAFEEEVVTAPVREAVLLGESPMGKVPFLRTPQGPISESQVIVDYIESAYPTPSLMPADPYTAAKVRELCTYLDLHIELAARDLYGTAFFGAPPMSEAAQGRVKKLLDKSLPAFKRLAKFSPYVAGDQFTLADCCAFAALPVAALATKAVLGTDLIEAHGIDHRSYMKLLAERPSVQRVNADRKAYQAAMVAKKPA
jgi:glutathione S-transferase